MSAHAERIVDIRETRQAMGSLFGIQSGEPELPELRPLPVTEPGFYDMTSEEYHRDPCPEPSLSASFACELVSSTPAHARLKHRRLTPGIVDENADHFDFGEVAHALFLEGRDVVEVLEFSDFRTKDARAARDAAREAGKIPLKRATWGELEAMLRTTRPQLDAHEDGAAMFRDGVPEVVMVWVENGLWFRSRVDWLRLSVRLRQFAIDDYKTAATASPYDLDRIFYNNGWDIQAAFYRRGMAHLTGFGAEFRFAVQEKDEPFALSVVEPSPSYTILGEQRVQKAIELWRRCLLENAWPGYPLHTLSIEVPPYIERQWLDREANDGV